MAKPSYRTKPDPKNTGWPSGVSYIIGNEGCERFSYYGMKAILYMYVVMLYVNLSGMTRDDASSESTATTHLFFGAVYALPIIGAIISDRWLGKYRTIFWLSLVYCLGHAALAAFENPTLQKNLFGSVLIDPIYGLYLGLGLIAIGSGGIKPCVSAHVGDQFGPSNWHLIQKVFNGFYFIINFGSAFATILIPLIRGDETTSTIDGKLYIHYEGNVSLAFAVPGILMGLATFFFWMGRNKFVHVPATHPNRLGLLDVLCGSALFIVIGYPIIFHDLTPNLWTAAISVGAFLVWAALFTLRQRIEADDGFLAVMFYSVRSQVTGGGDEASTSDDALENHWFFGPAARRFGREAAEGPVAVLKIMSVFLMVSVFWALFEQHSSTWLEQARQMDRVVRFGIVGWLALGVFMGAIVGVAIVITFRKDKFRTFIVTACCAAVGAALGWLAWRGGPSYDLQPSQVPAINPFLVMILIPYTTFGLYPLLKHIGIEPTPLRRMTVGMFMASAAFVAVAILQQVMDSMDGTKVHVGWQLIPYIIITLAEVMISITGLEFAYTQAPKRMKSVIMGFWLLNVSIGNFLVVFLTRFKALPPAWFFWIFAGLMAVAAALFGLRAAFYKYQDHTQ